VHNPKIVLLDEPTADLDPGLRHQIWGLIKKINESGVTVVVASHFLEELEPLCHRIALLANGKLAAVGSAEELKHLFAGSELIKLKSSPGNYNLLCQWLRHYFGDNITHFSAHNGELAVYAKNSSVMLNYIFSLAKRINEKISNIEVHKLNSGQISGWRLRE
jgi:ABC-2 type transport system ATP-binding protein